MKVLLAAICLTLLLIKYIQAGEYFKVDGRAYYISYPLKKNWYQALRFCGRKGMYLLDIRTEAENVRVLGLIEKFNKIHNTTALIYWTSGSDLGSETSYYWMTTGEELLYTYWSSGSPDNYRYPETNETENCLVIQGAWDNYWNDGLCVSEYPFICRDVYDVPILKTPKCAITLGEL